jgi:uncharacterized membrane protein YvbJ
MQTEEIMNTCWKCGRPIAEGKVECDCGCASRMSEEDTQKFARCLEQLAKRRRLDWSKVATIEDLICVISTLFGDATVDPDSAVARKLERFLEAPRVNTDEPDHEP